MLEIAQGLQSVAVRLSPQGLLVAGLTALLAGLFIWLAGLAFSRALIAVLAGLAAGCAAIAISTRDIITPAIIASLAAVIAAAFHKLLVPILAFALAAFIAAAVLSPSSIPGTGSVKTQISLSGPPSGSPSILHTISRLASQIAAAARQLVPGMSLRCIVTIIVIAVVLIAISFFLWSLVSAFCWSCMGTLFVFSGMILLLIYKGSAPVKFVSSAPAFYGSVFAAMVAFGTAEQYLLCRPPAKKQKAKSGEKISEKKKADKSSDE